MDQPTGTAPPPPPPAGTAPVSLTLLKNKLDKLADRLGEVLIGRRIPIEPNDTVTRFPHPLSVVKGLRIRLTKSRSSHLLAGRRFGGACFGGPPPAFSAGQLPPVNAAFDFDWWRTR